MPWYISYRDAYVVDWLKLVKHAFNVLLYICVCAYWLDPSGLRLWDDMVKLGTRKTTDNQRLLWTILLWPHHMMSLAMTAMFLEKHIGLNGWIPQDTLFSKQHWLEKLQDQMRLPQDSTHVTHWSWNSIYCRLSFSVSHVTDSFASQRYNQLSYLWKHWRGLRNLKFLMSAWVLTFPNNHHDGNQTDPAKEKKCSHPSRDWNPET